MTSAGFPVPPGFIVTSEAYFKFVRANWIDKKIAELTKGLDVQDTAKLNRVSDEVKAAIMAGRMSGDLEADITAAYNQLCGVTIPTEQQEVYVAVRSSATAEDLPEASFAGQQETYLNMKGAREVVDAVKKCWASLFGARAIYYRQENKFDHMKVGIAVPVQLMVQSDVSGIMFTVNPITNSKNEVSIESAYGLGQPVVSGELTPDQYLINKKTGKITSKFISSQTWQLTLNGNIPVSRKHQKVQKMRNKHILELAKLGVHIEKHYKH